MEVRIIEKNVFDEKGQRFSALDKTALEFARLAQQYLEIEETSRARPLKFTKDDIRTWIENPHKSYDKLIDVSRYLYTFSPHYKRLIDYFAGLSLWSYSLEPYGVDFEKLQSEKDKISKNYQKASRMLNNMNLKHEMHKIAKTCFREDIFYGYEHEVGDSYYIQKLNPKQCKIVAIEDGVYSFAFDFSYFDSHQKALKLYAEEFQEKYLLYKKSKNDMRWQMLDTYKSICLKMNEDLEFIMPPMAATFESVYDIDIAKKLRDTKDELGNYKILVQKLPLRPNSDLNNDFAIDYETMTLFHNQISKAVPESVGVITTPMEIDDFKLEEQKTNVDKVLQSENAFWNGAGVAQSLFNADKLTAGTLEKSIKTDEMVVFGFMRQVERWLNRKLRNKFKFIKVRLLDITHFNKDEVFENALKAAQFGVPLKSAIGGSFGMSPDEMMKMSFIENEILKMTETFVPLQSSHTQGGQEQSGGKSLENGRPVKDDTKREGNGEAASENNDEYK